MSDQPVPQTKAKQPWLKFYPADWRSEPSLRICSVGARGLWMEMLCVMHDADPCGSLVIGGKPVTIAQLAGLVGNITVRQAQSLFDELEAAKVFSRDEDGTIFSRRIRRDIEKTARDKANGGAGGSPELRRGKVEKSGRSRPYRKSDAPEKTARIFAKTGGKCFWCDTVLDRECTEDNANFFQVDHLLPVCDGGNNDEDNLVPACAVCNHDRARVGWPGTSRRNVDPVRTKRSDPTLWSWVSVGNQSDTKAQKPEARSQSPEEDAWVSVRERVTTAFEKANSPNIPDTSHVAIWKSRGHDPEICVAVVSGMVAKKPSISTLKYFDQAIADAHIAPVAKARDGPAKHAARENPYFDELAGRKPYDEQQPSDPRKPISEPPDEALRRQHRGAPTLETKPAPGRGIDVFDIEGLGAIGRGARRSC